jgi:hypothetical protein
MGPECSELWRQRAAGAVRTLGEAGPLAAILTALLVKFNARFLVYSASLPRRWLEQPG